MFTRKPRLQLEKFAIDGAKRLLQHNLPTTDTVARPILRSDGGPCDGSPYSALALSNSKFAQNTRAELWVQKGDEHRSTILCPNRRSNWR